MSAICSEFVQNAWRKDLCSNCFKARSDHMLTNGTPADDSGGLPPLVAAPKIAPYVPFKRTILEINRSNGTSNNNNKLISNNNHNIDPPKFFNGTSAEQPSSQQRKIGSSGVHLWEVGQMPQAAKNGSLDREVEVEVGLTNGEEAEVSKAGGTSKPGILKEKPAGPQLVKKAVNQPGQRSSVVFIDESQVIGYGGNDYNWDDDESSEEPSDVDSLENFDLTEEDKVFGELTDRNTEYNADNTNLLLNESRKQMTSIFTRQVGGATAATSPSVAAKLNPQSFYSMPAKSGHKTAVEAQDGSGRWVSGSTGLGWEDAAQDWSTMELPERDLGEAVPLTYGLCEVDSEWSTAELPEKDSERSPRDKSNDAPPLVHGSGKAALDWSSVTPLTQDFKDMAPDWSAVVQTEHDSGKAALDFNGVAPPTHSSGRTAPNSSRAVPMEHSSSKAAPDFSGAATLTLSSGNAALDLNGAAPLMHSSSSASPVLNGMAPPVQHDANVRISLSSEASSSSSTGQPSNDARCFIDSLFSAESDPVRLSFLTSEDSEEDENTSVVKPGIAPDSSFAATAHRAGSVTVPTRKHPVTHRATAQQLFNEEPVTAAELQAVSQKLPPTGDPRAWLQSDESSSLMSSKPLVVRNRHCSPYGIVPISVARAKGDYAASKPQEAQQAPVIPSVPPPSSKDESQRYPYLPRSSLPSVSGAALANGKTDDSAAAKDASLPRSGLGPCSTFHSPAPRDMEARFRNREYAAVNYSCHYASSYITNGGSSALAFTTLPPTPLTNPYSSTAILKGIPQVPERSPERSPPQKPRPLTKPKPKLPVKPVNIQRRSSEEGPKAAEEVSEASKVQNNRSPETPEAAACERVFACYQEIDGEGVRKASSFDSKVASLSNALDFGKKTPKRQAPRPPTGSSNGRKQDIPDDSPYKKSAADHGVASRRSSDQSSLDAGPPAFHMQRTVTIVDQQHANGGLDRDASESMPNEGSFSASASSGRTSSYSLNAASKTPSSGTSFHHQKETPLFRENGKPKKSRFSLKKLLKFGSSSSSSKEDGEDHRSKGKGLHHHSNGRTKLEILHPIDLINSAANEASEANDPTSDRGSGAETGSSSKTSSIGSNKGVAMSEDVGYAVDARSEKHEPGPVDSPSDCNQPRYKPPPPPRSRSQTEESGPGSKDKPSRPPPPIKRGHTLTRTPAVDNCAADEPHQEETSTPVLRNKEIASGTALENEENRNSVYAVGMEYANLGDVRNKLAPKKPGRCSSNSMMDVSLGCESMNGEDSNVSGSQENVRAHETRQFNGHALVKTEVTYYAPPDEQPPSGHRDEEAVDFDDLYADQTTLTSDHSPFSSINLDSLSSNSSNAKADPQSPPVSESCSSGCTIKVYERVVPKGGISEKVYAKVSAAVPPTPQENGTAAASASSEPDESDLPGALAWPRRKSSRLSLRKTKTVVHKNLEDNYGAVVSANHQTLTQILEQVTLTQQANASKVKMLGEVSPHWSDFGLTEDSPVTIVGDKAFYGASWQQNLELTLMVSPEPLCTASHATRNSCVVLPIVEFEDVIPAAMFSGSSPSDQGYRRGTVWVLERTRVETLTGAAESLRSQSATDAEAYERDTCFILLQLINGLKHLQVLGIEEVDALATDFALTMKRNDVNRRLVILPPSEKFQKKAQEKLSLCQSALSVMLLMLNAELPEEPSSAARLDAWTGEIPADVPSGEAFGLIAQVLRQERATSLSRAKLLLEYLLWGPTDLQGFQGKEDAGEAAATPEEELAYQRWLDLERATVLNNLIRTQSLWQIRLTVFEEYMLSFLVRTCAKTLRDAAKQLRVNQFGNA